MSQLSVTFFSDDPNQQPESLTSAVNKELIAFISEKAVSAGYGTIKDLAKAFDTKNPDKIIRILQEFFQTANLNPNYMNQLLRLLHIAPGEIDTINKRHRDSLFADMDVFVQHFDLILRNGSTILEDERYRNISFYGLSIRSIWVGRHRPLTLGELFYHYKHGDWITPDCCGSVYVISGGGSALSGCNSYQGYCALCRKVYSGSRPSFKEILRPFLSDAPDFAYQPSSYTVSQLVDDLLKLESN